MYKFLIPNAERHFSCKIHVFTIHIPKIYYCTDCLAQRTAYRHDYP